MENRSVEIAQKKARRRAGNQEGIGAAKRPLVTNSRRSDKPIFFTAPDLKSHPARFPSDVILAPRPINSTSLLVLALATPAARPAPTAAPDAKAGTAAAAPRKRARTTPAVARTTRKKAAKPSEGRPKDGGKATKTAKPKTKAACAAEAVPPAKRRAKTRIDPAEARGMRRRSATAMESAAPSDGADTPIILLTPPTDPVTISPDAAVADTAHADTTLTPLPRARTVALYRKGNLFDLIGYWCRAGWAGLARSLGARRRPH